VSLCCHICRHAAGVSHWPDALFLHTMPSGGCNPTEVNATWHATRVAKKVAAQVMGSNDSTQRKVAEWMAVEAEEMMKLGAVVLMSRATKHVSNECVLYVYL